MEPQGKECSPACRGSRESLLQGSFFVNCIWAPWSLTTAALLCSPPSLLTGPLSSISAWLGGMATTAPVHKLSQFKNLKSELGTLESLWPTSPQSSVCRESKALCVGRHQLEGGGQKSLWRCGGF